MEKGKKKTAGVNNTDHPEKKKEEQKRKRRRVFLRRYLVFFLLMSFVITCSMLLFITFMVQAMDIKVSAENVRVAALVTFGNVLFLAGICTLIDKLRRWIMVDRPLNRILEATDKMIEGDYSARIDPVFGIDQDSGFPEIISNINKMAEELSGVELLRTDFISNVSHELKTPLAVIQNYAALLQDESLSPGERKEYVKTILDSSKNLAELITNILRLNKLEKQQIYPEKKEFNLSEQLCECLLGFEGVWDQKGISIDSRIEDDLVIKGDPDLLSLVWNNLFSNALKYTGPGGEVGVSAMRNGDEVRVLVTDTGCGMDEETIKHIFDKFYQGDTSHATRGNGLGLALVKRVMAITGGRVEVTSEVGKGSCFKVILPQKNHI